MIHPGRMLVLLVCASGGCVETGQEPVAVPLFLAGTDVTEPIPGAGGSQIRLERAELAFGPLYLCAGSQAGELCDTARLEWVQSTIVDALEPSPVEVGSLSGVTGVVQSWMYDLGITSLLTRQEPLLMPAARELDDNSLRLRGRATVESTAIPFSIDIAIEQTETAEYGIPVVRKSPNEPFEHEVTTDESALLIRFDSAPWVSQIDFSALLEDEGCSPEGPTVVCAEQVEQICDEQGDVVSEQDCTDQEQVCIRGAGCVDRIELQPGSQAFRSVRNQVVAGPRPQFSWEYTP